MQQPTQPRVLFLHGFESDPDAPQGKVADLRAEFEAVDAPALQTGKLQFHRRNSVLRCLLRLPALRAAAALAAGSLLACTVSGAPLRSSLLCLALPLAWMAAVHKWLVASAVEASVVASLAVARDAVTRFRPDVVVGSSWGGGLATLLVQQGHWHGRVALLAPAGRRIAQALPSASKTREQLLTPLPSRTVGVVVHGTRDTVVPPIDSKLLTAHRCASGVPVLAAVLCPDAATRTCFSTRSPQMVLRTCGDGHTLSKALHRAALAALVREVVSLPL